MWNLIKKCFNEYHAHVTELAREGIYFLPFPGFVYMFDPETKDKDDRSKSFHQDD
jgi:hypothetical protein